MSVDVNTVINVLLGTLSADAVQRKESERQIGELSAMPGSLALLLEIASAPVVRNEARQAASIAAKALIKSRWADHGSPEARQMTLAALLTSDSPLIREQLAECVNSIATEDFPVRWPELIPTLLENLRHYNALLALRRVVKRYEYKSKEGRAPLEDLIVRVFPALHGVLQEYLTLLTNGTGEPKERAQWALSAKMILKTFWSCTQLSLPEEPQRFVMPFFPLVKIALESDAPQMDGGIDRRELEAMPGWKLKKWAAQIASRFLQRYGRAKYCTDKQFAEDFSKQVSPMLLESMLGLLLAQSRGRYVSSRVTQLAFTFVEASLEVGRLYKLLKPHLDFVLFESALPAMCISHDDIATFDSDPLDFVRRSHDPMEDFFEPRCAATNLVVDAVQHRAKDVFQKILGTLSRVLQSYEATPLQARTLEASRVKDGALACLGALSEALSSRKQMTEHIRQVLIHHVLPEFQSPHGWLRSRACWVVQRFADDEAKIGTDLLRECARLVLGALKDPALPVRVEAASALRQVLTSDSGAEYLKPALPEILESCFAIMAQASSDDVVQALEIVVDRYASEIAPFARRLAENLAEAFGTYAAAAEDDEEAAMAAAQCIEAMTAVLASLEDSQQPQLYAELEPVLVPVLFRILAGGDEEAGLVEYMENALQVLSYLTYHGLGDAGEGQPLISARLWSLFEPLVRSLESWAYDYFSEMLGPLDNFISRDTPGFLKGALSNGESRLAAVSRLCERFLSPEGVAKGNENECIKASQLLLSVLHNCKDNIDQFAAAYVRLTCASLAVAWGPRPVHSDELAPEDPDDGENKVYRRRLGVALINVWSSLLWYNARLALDTLASVMADPRCAGQAQLLLRLWIELAPRTHSTGLGRKLASLGFSAALRVPEHALVQPIAAMALAQLLQAINAQHEAAAKPKEEEDDDEDYEDYDEDENDPDDAEDIGEDADVDENDEEDEDEGHFLNTILGKSRVHGFDFGDDDDDDDEDDDDYYASPLDNVTPLVELGITLRLLHARGAMEPLASLLDATAQAGLAHYGNLAAQLPEVQNPV